MHSSRIALKASQHQLGLWLAFIAGAINAGGFLLVGHYTSHMTGIASSIGDFVALRQWQGAFAALVFLSSFIGGALATAMLVNLMRDRMPGQQYSAVLFLEAVLLLLFIVLAWLDTPLLPVIALLCFMMGLQNALITKISGATIRTTHITGLATDFGIELGRRFYRTLSRNSNVTLEPAKLTLFGGLIAAFIGGGIVGAIAILQLGILSLLPYVAALIWLAIDIRRPLAA